MSKPKKRIHKSIDCEVMIDSGLPHLQEINMGRGDRANGFRTVESAKAFIDNMRKYDKAPKKYVVVETQTVHTIFTHYIEETL